MKGGNVRVCDQIVKLGWCAAGEVRVAECIDLVPGKFDVGWCGVEVEECEDGRAVGVVGDPRLLRLVAQVLDVERARGDPA